VAGRHNEVNVVDGGCRAAAAVAAEKHTAVEDYSFSFI
jgi:hypothetical protein